MYKAQLTIALLLTGSIFKYLMLSKLKIFLVFNLLLAKKKGIRYSILGYS